NMGLAQVNDNVFWVGCVFKLRGQIITGGKKQLPLHGVIGNPLVTFGFDFTAYLDEMRDSAYEHDAGGKDSNHDADGEVRSSHDNRDGNDHDGRFAFRHAL